MRAACGSEIRSLRPKSVMCEPPQVAVTYRIWLPGWAGLDGVSEVGFLSTGANFRKSHWENSVKFFLKDRPYRRPFPFVRATLAALYIRRRQLVLADCAGGMIYERGELGECNVLIEVGAP